MREARRIVRMEADAERQELASRIRAKIREEKLANAKLMKTALPNVQGETKIMNSIQFGSPCLHDAVRETQTTNFYLDSFLFVNLSGQIIDPIKFHIARRTVRQARLLQSQLEEFLTWNSAEVLYGLLGGASVSIHHVEQQTTR